MATITLRQSDGNTEVRLSGVAIANSPLSNIQVDNNFNNLNNQIDTTYTSANTTANTLSIAFGVANGAYSSANASAAAVPAAFNTANQAISQVNTAYSTATASFDKANTALTLSQAAYNSSNGKYNSTGGTISGDVRVTGTLQIDKTLIISGNVNTLNANNLSVVDNMIYLNDGSNTANPDLGFSGNYNDGTYRHTGFFRDASDGVWKVFDQYVPEPGASVYIDTSNNTFRIADFQANNAYFGKIYTTKTDLVSNLNSYLLNSQQASYYLSANNLTGSIPNAVLANSAVLMGNYTLNQGVGTANNVQFNSLGVGTAASGTAGEVRATNNVTAYYSDKRLKEILSKIPNALDKVNALSGIYFKQNEKAEEFGYNNYERQVGVIAQEVQTILPEVIKPAPFDIDEFGNSISGENYLTVQYEKLVPLLIEAIKELSEKVERLENAS